MSEQSESPWLEGVTVLDLSRLLPGPFCTMLLGDMGADVLKVERPGHGDGARRYPPEVEGVGALFGSVNRNKRSITLDLKSDEGREVLLELVDTADVLLESFRPGVMERLDLGAERLRDRSPELVYCAISGYGRTGPLRERAGHDLNYIARAGLLDQNRQSDEAPTIPGCQLADIAGGGLYAALGILGALYRRTRTGQGETLDISMTEGALSLQLPRLAGVAAGTSESPGEGVLDGGVAAYNVYRTADDEYLAVGALEPKFWTALTEAIDAPELATDGLVQGENGREARRAVAEILADKPRDEWLEIFEGREVCCEPVQSPAEVLEDRLFEARDVFFELAGIRQGRTPVTPPEREHAAPPDLGEHTSEVLEDLGYEESDIERLRREEVV